jgi:hypothetical protein
MKKPYSKMNARELAAATREFDKPGAADKFKPLTAAQRKQWNQMVKGPKRSRRKDEDGVRIVLSIDPELLYKAHRYAREHGNTLSQLICEGLEIALRKRSA